MAEKIRNVNLEEIDSDTLFGIDAFKGQTLFQKIIFFGSLTMGILENVFLSYFTEIPRFGGILIFIALLLIGIAFGCNYTPDMTYGKYLYYFFFKPSKDLIYQSTEDMKEVRRKAEEAERRGKKQKKEMAKADPLEQRKLLMKLLLFVLLMVLIITGCMVYMIMSGDKQMHHTVRAALYLSGRGCL